MKVPFIKMHAQGNDFIILVSDKIMLSDAELQSLALTICDRHFGIGADGLVFLDNKEPKMTIYNADGSRAEMCGSALRCCCSLLFAQTGKKELHIETESGIRKGTVDSGNPSLVTVEMGRPQMIENNCKLAEFTGDYISVGNPHYVIFMNDSETQQALARGAELSVHQFFQYGANIEFARIKSTSEIDLLIWERGVGATLACGTGSVAAVFSGHQRNLLDKRVSVNVPGGCVIITNQDSLYYLSGEAVFVAGGVFAWKI